MKQHKKKMIAAVLILCVLVAAYFWEGNHAGKYKPHSGEISISTEKTDKQRIVSENADALVEPFSSYNEESKSSVKNADDSDTAGATADIDTDDGDSQSDTKQKPSETVGDKKLKTSDFIKDIPKNSTYTCTLSVRCGTILDNIERLDKEKWELVPENGIIFPVTEVIFYEGESVFNILQREMKKNKIHMEFRNTPVYDSVYIWGINNLYEFDAGELSGWMYKVNGCFPDYSASCYQLEDGNVIEWIYTCDLGRDIGGYHAAGGE